MAELVAEGVVRLGTPLVNWYLVEDSGRVTVVDGGLPRYRPQLEEGLRLLDRAPSDVEALSLTHAHGDHVGVAEIPRNELGVPVLVHAEDEELARTLKSFGKTGPRPSATSAIRMRGNFSRTSRVAGSRRRSARSRRSGPARRSTCRVGRGRSTRPGTRAATSSSISLTAASSSSAICSAR
jgi:hypothetical protein